MKESFFVVSDHGPEMFFDVLNPGKGMTVVLEDSLAQHWILGGVLSRFPIAETGIPARHAMEVAEDENADPAPSVGLGVQDKPKARGK